jgi:hypothetical protein
LASGSQALERGNPIRKEQTFSFRFNSEMPNPIKYSSNDCDLLLLPTENLLFVNV